MKIERLPNGQFAVMGGHRLLALCDTRKEAEAQMHTLKLDTRETAHGRHQSWS